MPREMSKLPYVGNAGWTPSPSSCSEPSRSSPVAPGSQTAAQARGPEIQGLPGACLGRRGTKWGGPKLGEGPSGEERGERPGSNAGQSAHVDPWTAGDVRLSLPQYLAGDRRDLALPEE